MWHIDQKWMEYRIKYKPINRLLPGNIDDGASDRNFLRMHRWADVQHLPGSGKGIAYRVAIAQIPKNNFGCAELFEFLTNLRTPHKCAHNAALLGNPRDGTPSSLAGGTSD